MMVSLKPIERIVRYKFGLEFLGRREGKGRTRRSSESVMDRAGSETSAMRQTALATVLIERHDGVALFAQDVPPLA